MRTDTWQSHIVALRKKGIISQGQKGIKNSVKVLKKPSDYLVVGEEPIPQHLLETARSRHDGAALIAAGKLLQSMTAGAKYLVMLPHWRTDSTHVNNSGVVPPDFSYDAATAGVLADMLDDCDWYGQPLELLRGPAPAMVSVDEALPAPLWPMVPVPLEPVPLKRVVVCDDNAYFQRLRARCGYECPQQRHFRLLHRLCERLLD